MTAYTAAEDGSAQPTIAPDLDEAQRFLAILDPSAKPQDWHYRAIHPNNGAKKANSLFDLQAKNLNGWGAFVVVNAGGDNGASITRIRGLFVDFDVTDDHLDRLGLVPFEPSLIVESSKGKHHAYWLMDGVPLDAFERAQRKLITLLDSDPNITDLPRVMRLPGYLHTKGTPYKTTICHEGPRHDWADFSAWLATLPEPCAEPQGESRTGTNSTPDGILQELLSGANVHANALRIVARMVAKGHDDGAIRLVISNAAPHVAAARGAERASALMGRELDDLIASARVKFAPEAEQQPSQAGVRPRFLLLDGADLAANAKAPLYLVDEILEEDAHGIMGGLSMTYKSFLSLRLAYSVCTGEPFMGRQVYRTGPVIYVCGEGAGGISRRWKALQLKLGSVPAGSFYMYGSPLQLRDAVSVRALQDAVEQLRPALVIFDTFASLAGGVDENSPTEVGNALANVRRVCQAGGASSLIVHHFGKDATKGFRGASNFTNDVDFAFMVNRPEGDQVERKACMVCHKMKDGDPFAPVHFKAKPVPLGLIDQKGQEVYSLVVEESEPSVDAASILESGTQWEKALEALRICWRAQRDRLELAGHSSKNPAVTWEDWVEAMASLQVSNTRRERDKLKAKGLIECLAGNEYRPKD